MRSCSICLSMPGLFHSAQCPLKMAFDTPILFIIFINVIYEHIFILKGLSERNM